MARPGNDLITRAASSGLTVDVWTIMPLDFGGAGQDMGRLTEQATDGLERAVRGAYPDGDSCSGVSRNAWDFTRTFASFQE